jgi:hypothetical protein
LSATEGLSYIHADGKEVIRRGVYMSRRAAHSLVRTGTVRPKAVRFTRHAAHYPQPVLAPQFVHM